MNVDAIRSSGVGGPQGYRVGFDQAAQNLTGLAAESTAENGVRAEGRRQARDPQALSAGMQVHLGAVGTGLDRDREQRGAKTATRASGADPLTSIP